MTSTSFTIRAAAASEYEALGELTVRSYHHGGFIDGPDDDYAQYLRDTAHRAASARILVAVDHDGDDAAELLGGVTLAFHGSPTAELAQPGDAEIRALAVAPAAQGRGVGAALTSACVERAHAEPATKRIVLCSQRTMRGAHRLYERLGFERAIELDWEPSPGIILWGFTLEL